MAAITTRQFFRACARAARGEGVRSAVSTSETVRVFVSTRRRSPAQKVSNRDEWRRDDSGSQRLDWNGVGGEIIA